MVSKDLKILGGPEFYTIAWIAALPIERAAAVVMLNEEHNQPNGFSQHERDPNSYTWGRIGEHNVVIASLAAGIYGPGSAARIAAGLLSSLPTIRVGLLVGIGGGIARPDDDRDIRLGDVAVSQPDGTTGGVCQYDLVKARPGDNLERKGFLAAPPRVLLNAIAHIQSVHERRDSEIPRFLEEMLEASPKMAGKSQKSPGYIHQGFENDRLFQSSYEHVAGTDCRGCEIAHEVQREERESTDPEIHYGIIASGNTLVKDAIARDRIIASVGEDCICFEMDAAGLMNHFPCLVIRGICNYADSHSNDHWQRYASATAAAYTKELLGYVPAVEVQASKKVLEILESVNDVIGATQKTSLAVKAAVDSIVLDSLGQKIRAWLAAPDPNTNANQARKLRHAGTGAWLLEDTTFKSWMSGAHKHLWLRGMAGCGKTVLSTTILDYIAKDDNLVILSFFFDFSDSMKQNMNGMLRSLALQLYQGGHDSAGHLSNLMRAHKNGEERPTTATLEEIVRVILKAQGKVMIVLDALDESTAREETLLWLRAMFNDTELGHVQVIYTSREEAEFMQRIPEFIGQQCCLLLDAGAIDIDIRSYVMTRTHHDTGFTRKGLSDSLLGRIQTEVGNGANGMFRWAAGQLDSLSRCLSPHEIQKTLRSLPTTLEETYDRMIQSIPREYRSSAIRLLQFIVYTRRPLTLKEAVEIVATDVEEEYSRFDVSHRLFDDIDILRYCPGLLSVTAIQDKRGTTLELHLAHFSVKEYLLLRKDFSCIDASAAIIKTCLAYLRDIEGSFWNLAEEFPLAEYVAECWMDFAAIAEVSEDVATVIISFLHSQEALGRLSYLIEAKFYGSNDPDIHSGSALYFACLGGLVVITTSIIDKGIDVNEQQGGYLGSPLHAASFHGHVDVVRLLLDRNADINAQCGAYGSVLQTACYGDQLNTVRLLIERNAEVNMQCGEFGTALQAASYKGNIDIVQLLLERNGMVDIQGGRHGNALQAAAYGGNEKVVRRLLDLGADVTTTGGNFDSALQAACRGNKAKVTRLLLDLGADTNHDSEPGSALHTAASTGDASLVEMLVELGAGDDGLGSGSTNSTSALLGASHEGHSDVVRILLSYGADVSVHAEIG